MVRKSSWNLNTREKTLCVTVFSFHFFIFVLNINRVHVTPPCRISDIIWQMSSLDGWQTLDCYLVIHNRMLIIISLCVVLSPFGSMRRSRCSGRHCDCVRGTQTWMGFKFDIIWVRLFIFHGGFKQTGLHAISSMWLRLANIQRVCVGLCAPRTHKDTCVTAHVTACLHSGFWLESAMVLCGEGDWLGWWGLRGWQCYLVVGEGRPGRVLTQPHRHTHTHTLFCMPHLQLF